MCIAVGDYGDRRPAASSDVDAVKNLGEYLFYTFYVLISLVFPIGSNISISINLQVLDLWSK